MRSTVMSALAVAVLALGSAGPGFAQDAKPEAAAKAKPDRLPADASVHETVKLLNGKSVAYTATAGSLPVKDAEGNVIGEVAFTAFTQDGPRSPDRPVTFAFNGGPGAASVYLDLGLIGPKTVPFGAQGQFPSSATRVSDNPQTWLEFTDLVFIDPIGTGFSRSYVSEDKTKKAFYGTEQDIKYLSRIVYDWLLKNQRMGSPKYLVGESYGGFRLPRLAYTLQSDLGVGIWGMTLVSPRLDYHANGGRDLSPMVWASTLPSMAAAKRERDGAVLTAADMTDVEEYARSEYTVDLLRGARDAAAVDRVSKRVAAYTGLDPALVQRMGGRIDLQTFVREFQRDKGVLASRYDVNVTAYDPFPWSAQNRAGDPILEGIIAPTTSAMVDYVTRQIGWKVDGTYEALSNEVNRMWERNDTAESSTALRQALALDPSMKVLIVHGFTDIQTPYFQSRLIIDQIPVMGAKDQIQLKVYPGGHMFYSRPDSRAALRRDVQAVYR
ncbi:S10 family peptidase [Caulobacter sp. 17J80-11]|uniref:S10 family peptidase n=1 Tax=Caulobacter sp. 17J80-11 TaxID=2763502 RepID=UPI002106011E|nr:peptidase S10 [Caulobacter sp. 17J80-11]